MYLFEPSARPALTIAGDERMFPIRQVYCIGRNYADHAAEMGFEATPESPFYFLKPAECVTQKPVVPFAVGTQKLQHEVELVVALKSGGRGTDTRTSSGRDRRLRRGPGLDPSGFADQKPRSRAALGDW